MTNAAPVVVRVANCKGVSTTPAKSRAIFRRALTEPGHYGKPHIVLAMEMLKVDAEGCASELVGWEAIQYGYPHDLARAGSVIAYNPEYVQARGRRLVETSPAGDGTRTRFTVRAPLAACGHQAEPFNAGHAPPDRSEGPQRRWYERSKHIDGIFGADFNDRPDFLEARYGRQVCAVRGEVLGLLAPARIPVSDTKPIDIGSDHLGQDTVLWPAKEK